MSVLDSLIMPKGTQGVQQAIRLLERQRAILQARVQLMPFVRFTSPDHEDPDDVTRSAYDNRPFHDKIAEALEVFERGETPRLIFTMPPRMGKSRLATRSLAAWYAGRHPDHDIAIGTYSDQLAGDIGGDIRAIMSSPQFKQVFPEYKFRKGGYAKDNIQSSLGGRIMCVGRGAGLTGRGASLLVIDDVLKDHEEARSSVVRDACYNWFTSTAMTRLMNKKLVMIIMTRWHSDDLVGRLTDPENPHYSEETAAEWKIIDLPAIALDDDPLGRAPGELLWPERQDWKYLNSQRRLDPLLFEALFQQRPTVSDGILFKRENIRYYDGKPPEGLRYYAASDHAVGTKQRNDKTCLLKGGVDYDDDIYFTDCRWDRMTTDVVVEQMIDMHRGPTRPNLWWAEKGHITMSIGPFMFKRFNEERIYPNIIDMVPVKDKMARAQSLAGLVARGKVFFPRAAPWAERAINELLAAPNGTRDDFLDCSSWFGKGVQNMFRPERAKPKDEEPVFGTLAWVKRQETWAAQQAATANRGGF